MSHKKYICVLVIVFLFLCPRPAFCTTVPPVFNLPMEFDVGGSLLNFVVTNGTSILGAVVISTGIYVLACSARGFKRGLGRIAGGRLK